LRSPHASSPGWLGQALSSHPMVLVAVCGGDVVVVVVDDVVDGWDGCNVVGGAFLRWDA
jgi:hypothetical protein